MGKIYRDPEWPRCIYWIYDPETGWEGYNLELDEISAQAREVSEPFILIFHPQGDIPKNNPIPHMRRIVQFSKASPKVIKTIIIMGTDWAVAKAFASMLNKVLKLEPEVKLVFSVEEAREVYNSTMDSLTG